MDTQEEIETCVCGVKFVRRMHERTLNMAPIEVATSDNGNINYTSKYYRIVPVAERSLPFYRGKLHLNHFANCPHAAQFHRTPK